MKFHGKRFPNENDAYRAARNELLAAEIELRRQTEKVAALRRGLPPGGRLAEDYVFDEAVFSAPHTVAIRQVRFSELFADGKDSLIIYSFMYGPAMEHPCPSCTSILDGLNGVAGHVARRVNLVVVARSPMPRLRDWVGERSWSSLRLLSSANNSYNADYFAETATGAQLPALNVFRRCDDGIRHFYSAELLYAPADPGQEPRHVDTLWPLWNLFDMVPEGRGVDWHPQLIYPK